MWLSTMPKILTGGAAEAKISAAQQPFVTGRQ
jgi:uncharacterized membrane protein